MTHAGTPISGAKTSSGNSAAGVAASTGPSGTPPPGPDEVVEFPPPGPGGGADVTVLAGAWPAAVAGSLGIAMLDGPFPVADIGAAIALVAMALGDPPAHGGVMQQNGEGGDDSAEGRNPAQDKPLSKGEIKALEDGKVDVHDLKGGKQTGQSDLYKDKHGNIYLKPKGGAGPGEPTGLNIKDFM